MKLTVQLAALLITVVLLATGGSYAAGQPSPPAELAQNAAPLDAVPLLVAPAVDTQAELASISAAQQPGAPPRFGVSLAVSANPAGSGLWETLADGTQLWRLRVRSDAAQAVSLGFTRYAMPPGGRLVVYDPAYAAVRGPYTDQENESHGQLWTAAAPGDTLVIEVQLPPGTARQQLDLDLGSVVHAVLDPVSAVIEKSGSCNLDVVCPEAEPWRSQIRSVAHIQYMLGGGAYVCTGALVNNTSQDRRPLFLTAAHCEITSANAASVVTYWNFQSPTCRLPGSVASGATGVGSLAQSLSGAVWRASYAPSDMTLLELDDPVPDAYAPFWAGWDRSAAAPASAFTVHHPSGDEKRISFENNATSIDAWPGTDAIGTDNHIRISSWERGTTEGGSSGSPLFNPSGLVVGQLHGGLATCGNSSADWFGRLYSSWTGGGSVGTRLLDYLDPLGLGVTQLGGVENVSAVVYSRTIELPVVIR